MTPAASASWVITSRYPGGRFSPRPGQRPRPCESARGCCGKVQRFDEVGHLANARGSLENGECAGERPSSAAVVRPRRSGPRPRRGLPRAQSRSRRRRGASEQFADLAGDLDAATRGRRSGACGAMLAATRATPPPMRASVHRVNACPGARGRPRPRTRLHHEDRAAADEQRQTHRDDDDGGDLPSTGPREADEEVGSEDTDGHLRWPPR